MRCWKECHPDGEEEDVDGTEGDCELEGAIPGEGKSEPMIEISIELERLDIWERTRALGEALGDDPGLSPPESVPVP